MYFESCGAKLVSNIHNSPYLCSGRYRVEKVIKVKTFRLRRNKHGIDFVCADVDLYDHDCDNKEFLLLSDNLKTRSVSEWRCASCGRRQRRIFARFFGRDKKTCLLNTWILRKLLFPWNYKRWSFSRSQNSQIKNDIATSQHLKGRELVFLMSTVATSSKSESTVRSLSCQVQLQ